MRIKRVLAVILSTLMVSVLLAGCGSSGSSEPSPSSSGNGPKEVKKVTLKLATIYAPDHPVSIGIDKMAKTVLEKSGGKLEIQHFPAAQIGNEPSIHEGFRNGTVDMAVMGISEVGKRYAPVLIFDAPYIFRDADHMLKTFNSDIGKKLWADYEKETGIKMLAPIYYGTRLLTTNKPVSTIDDLKGMKIRVPDQKNSVEAWKAFGAVPTPMNLGEVYLSLQTGVVDGQENPLATIISSKFDEVVKYINMTEHSVQSVPLFISAKKYNELDDSMRKILDDAVATDIADITKNVRDYEVTELDKLEKSGKITVVKTDKNGFIEAIQPIIKEGESTWGAGLFDKIQQVK